MLNLDKNKKYLLACSCGPDSMALFFMLKNEGFSFDVAHVNYHLRKESNFEQETLEKYCIRNSIKIYTKNVNEIIDKNIEEKCRKIRYKFFSDLCINEHYESVLVAHQQDDVIETYLLQKKRGIFPKYYGIAYENTIFDVKITRPLLSYTKHELENICIENSVPYCVDSSNNLDIFERNKIRHEIVSKMSKENRHEIVSEIDRKNVALNHMFSSFKIQPNYDIKSILKMDDVCLAYFLNFLVGNEGCKKAVSKSQSYEIRKALCSDKANVQIPFSNSYFFIKEYEHFSFKKIEFKKYQYSINEPSMLDTDFFFSNIAINNKHGIKLEDYPLSISNQFSNKEKAKIKDYEVEVRRLYIDWKMPLYLRKRWPIVRNKENKIVFIPRYRADFVVTTDLDFYVKCVSL